MMDYCEGDSMLFSDVYHDNVPGMTVDFPTPKAFRVGSYSGSDCERKFQTFPTPPDSPVLAELTPPNAGKQQGTQAESGGFSQGHLTRYVLNEDCTVSSSSSPGAQPADMDLSMLMEDLLQSNMADHFSQQLCDSQYQSNVGLSSNDGFQKSDFLDNLSQFSPNSPITLTSSMFPSSFSESLDDCTIPSPAPSPSPITVCDIDIFNGDLPNLDDLTVVKEFAQMEPCQHPRSQHGAFGLSSSGEDSDIDSVVSGYSLPIDEIQPSTYNSLSSSVMSHPPPHYHEHHHNIQPFHHYRHTAHHQSQQPYPQHHSFNPAASAPNGRTHNYQCRTLHTTLKMLDTHADGVVMQEMSSQQGSCAGPIRKPFRARPRKQSVSSSDDGGSDEEHVVTTTTVSSGSGGAGSSPNRNRGRGRREAMKGNHLWEFIRDLLKSESHCPKFIRWEDREAGVFRFVNSEAVANMWGRKKNNPQMTYEKLSRAMRYYYKREILERVDGRRLVYKFGKNAEGWKEAAGLQ